MCIVFVQSDRGGRPELETVEGDVVDESHIFYKSVPPGFLGSKKPKSAEKVSFTKTVYFTKSGLRPIIVW